MGWKIRNRGAFANGTSLAASSIGECKSPSATSKNSFDWRPLLEKHWVTVIMSKIENIPVFKPLIEIEELDESRKSLELGWLGMGSSVGKFEEEIKKYIQADDRHVVAVSTGHAALHLGLMLMGVGHNDEVITPSFNNIADFQAILATGAAPVFCDIDPDTLCIDIEKAEQLITPNTKAIIVMDYDCMNSDHDAVKAFAQRHGIRVLHDAAHSFGSKYKGKMVGSFSDVTMFSFDPVKTITCIDGGALVVKTEEEMLRLHEMRLIGMAQPANVMYKNSRAWTYDVKSLGFRYHMANMHAAIGCAQVSKMGKISRSRQEACRLYSKILSGVKSVKVPNSDFDNITPFLYYILVDPAHRENLREYLSNSGIDTGIHWQPGHTFSLFEDCRRGDLSVTEEISRQVLSLPLHSMMSLEVVRRIAETIGDYFESLK